MYSHYISNERIVSHFQDFSLTNIFSAILQLPFHYAFSTVHIFKGILLNHRTRQNLLHFFSPITPPTRPSFHALPHKTPYLSRKRLYVQSFPLTIKTCSCCCCYFCFYFCSVDVNEITANCYNCYCPNHSHTTLQLLLQLLL